VTTDHAGDAIRGRRRSRPSDSIDQHVIRPVRRTNLSAEIADRIAEQIAIGKLNAGCRLQSERELSGRFGVGRSSIREAIKSLESRGLVEGRQGEGRFVRAQEVSGLIHAPSGPVSVTEREMQQLYEARSIVEPGMSALAAERASARDLAAARRLLERHELKVRDGKYGGTDDNAFHMKLAAMADSPLLARLLEAILEILHAAREPALRSAHGLHISLAGHWDVLHAVEAHDPDAARQATLVHLDRAQQLAVDVVRSRGNHRQSPLNGARA